METAEGSHMQNTLFQAICRVGIFMICAQAVVHFRPKEAYEKYLKLLVSVMVLIQIFLPIGGILLGKGGQDAVDRLEQFRRELEQDMQEAYEHAAGADALLEQMTLEEIRNRLEAEQAQEQASEGGIREDGARKEAAGEDSGQSVIESEAQLEDGKGQAGGTAEGQPRDDNLQGQQGDAREQESQGTGAVGNIKVDLGDMEPISIEPVQ